MLKRKIGRINYKEFDKPRFLRFVTVIMLRIYLFISLKFRINTENQLPQGPKIFAINHPTATDPFIIGTMFPNARILITKKAFDFKISNWILKKLGHIPVDKENGIIAYTEAKNTLLGGKDIIIFPEGVLSKKIGTMDRIKTGLTRLALETKATVVPIGVNIQKKGVKEFLFKTKNKEKVQARWYMFHKYIVQIGKGIKLHGGLANKKYIYKKSLFLQLQIQKLSRKYFFNTD